MPLVYIVIGWLFGIGIAAAAPKIVLVWPVIAFGGLLLAIIVRRERQTAYLALMFTAVGLGMWRYSGAQPIFTDHDLVSYNDLGYAKIVGTVDAQPDVRDNAVRLRVKVESYTRSGFTTPVNGYALVSADRNGDYAYGDRVQVDGEVQTPPTFDTFDYAEYLSRSGVYSIVPRAKITTLERGTGNPIQAAFIAIRLRSRHIIDQLLPNPQSALLSGIILGEA